MSALDQYCSSFREFCKSWGDSASVLGLFISLIGFGITIVGVLRAKRAADLAKEAANRATEKILKQGTLYNFSSAIALMENMLSYYRSKDWANAIARQSELRRILVELKDGGGGITDEQQTTIQGTLQHLIDIGKLIDRHVSDGKPEPNVSRFTEIVSGQIVKMHEISVNLKNK